MLRKRLFAFLEINARRIAYEISWPFKCTQCGEVPEHWQYATLSEEQALKGGRGSANFIYKVIRDDQVKNWLIMGRLIWLI